MTRNACPSVQYDLVDMDRRKGWLVADEHSKGRPSQARHRTCARVACGCSAGSSGRGEERRRVRARRYPHAFRPVRRSCPSPSTPGALCVPVDGLCCVAEARTGSARGDGDEACPGAKGDGVPCLLAFIVSMSASSAGAAVVPTRIGSDFWVRCQSNQNTGRCGRSLR